MNNRLVVSQSDTLSALRTFIFTSPSLKQSIVNTAHSFVEIVFEISQPEILKTLACNDFCGNSLDFFKYLMYFA